MHPKLEKPAPLLLLPFIFLNILRTYRLPRVMRTQGRDWRQEAKGSCPVPVSVRLQLSSNKSSKDPTPVPDEPWRPPEPLLGHTIRLPVFTFVILHLGRFSYMDTPAYQRRYGDRRRGFVFTGTDCLENFNLQTKQITFQNALFSLPYPIWVVGVS